MIRVFLFLLLFHSPALLTSAVAQNYDCSLKPPVVHIDFGSGKQATIQNARLPAYHLTSGDCPIDGSYSYVPATFDCFNGDWFTLTEDHTPGDVNGRMMLVNASESGGVFLSTVVRGLEGNKRYQFAAFMMNVCRLNGGCTPLPPNISIILTSSTGRKLAEYKTGQLTQRHSPYWKRYLGFFQTGPADTVLRLTMENNTLGGCGNDFVLDDITISECVIPTIELKPLPQKAPEVVVKKTPPPARPAEKKPVVVRPVVVTDNRVRTESVVQDTQRKTIPPQVLNKVPAAAPLVLRTRRNELVRELVTGAEELVIRLYDNGEIDGDTVSIYHNNERIVSRAGLSAKPIQFRIAVNAASPVHELTMVAENLGSIPPNTSLMIIETKTGRHQVMISASEQKNATVRLRLKE